MSYRTVLFFSNFVYLSWLDFKFSDQYNYMSHGPLVKSAVFKVFHTYYEAFLDILYNSNNS